jgi:hypothetical protein
MSEYNDIAELKIGDKIIIPEQKNAWDKRDIKNTQPTP